MWRRFKAAATRHGRVLVVAALGLFVLGVSAMPALATCDPAEDPTCGAAESTLGTVQGWITSHGVPMLVALFVIGLVVALLVKFGKRGTKAA